MKPIRTPTTTTVFKLPGGTDENDLPAEIVIDQDGRLVLETAWQPTAAELEAIVNGAPVTLRVWGEQHPPVSVTVADASPPFVTVDYARPAAAPSELVAHAAAIRARLGKPPGETIVVTVDEGRRPGAMRAIEDAFGDGPRRTTPEAIAWADEILNRRNPPGPPAAKPIDPPEPEPGVVCHVCGSLKALPESVCGACGKTDQPPEGDPDA